MAATTKVMSAAAIQLQSGSTFEDDAMVTLPVTSYGFVQKRNLIEDESYHGVAFKGLPQRGVNDTSGSIGINLELDSFEAYIAAITGYYSGGVARFDESTPNVNKYSIARRDGVSYKQYANVYPKSLKISGSPDNIISAELDLVGVTAEVRDSLANWPEDVTPVGEPFSFHETSSILGSGYVRLGDQTDALAAGDNIEISEFSLEIMTGYDAEHNNNYEIITPEFGQVRPEVTGSIKISKHSVDTFLGFRDNVTKLQMSILIYKSATKQLRIDIPNFVIDLMLSDDDLTKQDVTLKIGRNGIGTAYVNSNFSFTSPIRFTVTNS